MARPSGTITKATLEAAFRAARAGEEWSYPDPECRGLELRVRGGRVAWSFRGRLAGVQKRWTVGDHTTASKEAQRRAWRVRDLVARDLDPAAEITALVTGVPVSDQVPVESPKPSWEWTDAVERFLADIAKSVRRATVRDYRQTLCNTPELQAFAGRMVVDITAEEYEEAVEKVRERGVQRHHKKVLAHCKRLTKWLGAGARRRQTGVQKNLLAGAEAGDAIKNPNARVQNKGIPPEMAVGRALAIARAGVLPVKASLGVEGVLGTCQRRHAVVALHAIDVRPLPLLGHNHLYNWFVPPETRKSADMVQDIYPHQVPLVGWMADVIDELNRLLVADDYGWYFPARSEGGIQAYMSESVLNHTLSAMPGVHGLLSPHAIRRTLASTWKKLGYDKKDSTLILDHAEGRTTVTRKYYDLDPRIEIKVEMMLKWTKWLDELADEAIRKDPMLQPRNINQLREAVYRQRYGDEAWQKKLADARRKRRSVWGDGETVQTAE